jgi:lipopolysaccharide transport system permease protein
MNKEYIVIEAETFEKNYYADLWRFRELFIVLAMRDVAVRYKQTIIGLAWSLIQPLLTMVVFTVIFGKFAKLPTEGEAPYALMVYAGLLPWQFFSNSLTGAAGSLVGNSSLISKVYFPRLIVPVSAVIVSVIDILICFIILVGLLIWYQFIPGWQIFLLPVFFIMAFLASLGPGLLITALNVKYRDFRYIIPFIVQFGLFVSPVGFSSSVVPDEWRLLYSLNPLVGIIDGFRWAILGGESLPYLPSILLSFLTISFFLWMGVRKFRKMEKSFADLI